MNEKKNIRRAAAVIFDRGKKTFSAVFGSRQAPPEETFGKNILEPVYNPGEWAQFIGLTTRGKASVRIMTQNTVGLGYATGFQQPDYDELEENGEERKMVDDAASKLNDFLRRVGPAGDLTSMLRNPATDLYGPGNGYIEVTRDDGRRIIGMIHMPAKGVRKAIVKGSGGMFVQKTYKEQRFFKTFGDKTQYLWKNGKVAPPGAKWNQLASEVIHVLIYDSQDVNYGVPIASTCEASIAGKFQADRRNYGFFEGDALPRFVVLVSGGDDQTIEAIDKALLDFTAHVQGTSKTSRALAMQSAGGKAGEKPSIDVKELGQYSQDATFREYRRDCDDEVREAYGIAKVLYGTADDVNRAGATITLESTVMNVFWPASKMWDEVLTDVAREFHPLLTIKLDKADATDTVGRADVVKTHSEAGELTINELRVLAKYEEIDEDWANIPLVRVESLSAEGNRVAAAETVLSVLRQRVDEIRTGKAQEPPV